MLSATSVGADDRGAVRRRRRCRAARRSSPAWPAGRRSRCACRPAARSTAPTASSRRRAARGRSLPLARVVARGRAGRRRRLQGDRADRRAPRLVRTRSRRRRRRCSICCARSTRSTRDVTFRDQLARADGLHAGDRRPRRVERRTVRAALPSAAAARQRPDARAMRRPYTLDYYRRLVDGIVDAPAARLDRVRHDRRFPRRDRRGLRREPRRTCRASPLSHLHVFPYSDRPGTEATHACRDKVDGPVDPRARRRGCAQIGAELTRRFRQSQVGTDPSGADARGRHAGRDG